MLNILISLLKDHSSIGAAALNSLSLRRSKTPPRTSSTHPARHTCALFSSYRHRPSSLSVSIHRLWGSRLWRERRYWHRSCRTCPCQSRSSGAPETDGHLIRCSPVGRRIRVVSTGFTINRTSCPHKTLRLDFCSSLSLLRCRRSLQVGRIQTAVS